VAALQEALAILRGLQSAGLDIEDLDAMLQYCEQALGE
jgi:hypothetical protein